MTEAEQKASNELVEMAAQAEADRKQKEMRQVTLYFKDKVDLAVMIADGYPLKRKEEIFNRMVDHFLLVERIMLQKRVQDEQLMRMQHEPQRIMPAPGIIKPS